MTFSLAFTPAQGYYEMFAQAVTHFVPGQPVETRLRSATPFYLWVILGLMLAFIFGLVILAAVSTPNH